MELEPTTLCWESRRSTNSLSGANRNVSTEPVSGSSTCFHVMLRFWSSVAHPVVTIVPYQRFVLYRVSSVIGREMASSGNLCPAPASL